MLTPITRPWKPVEMLHRTQCNFKRYQPLQGHLVFISNLQMCQQIHIKERGPRVLKPPTQTARPPSITASRCLSYQCFSLVGSLLPPPQSRRSLGEVRRMGRGWFAQNRSVPHPPPLNPSLQALLIFFSPQKAAICLPCPGTAGSVPLCQRTVRSVPRQNEPYRINSTWWIKKKNIDEGRQDKAQQMAEDRYCIPFLLCKRTASLSAVYHAAPSFFLFI